jgi:hypothetical protein
VVALGPGSVVAGWRGTSGDHRLMLRSFERIGRDVMPRIRSL